MGIYHLLHMHFLLHQLALFSKLVLFHLRKGIAENEANQLDYRI